MAIIEAMDELAYQFVESSSMNTQTYYYPTTFNDLSSSSSEYNDCRRLNQNIPQDPIEWTMDDVRKCIKWITNELSFDDFEWEKINFNGKQLTQMDKTSFCSFFPRHAGEFIWRHILALIRHVCPKNHRDQKEMLEFFDYETSSNQRRSDKTPPQNYNFNWTNHHSPCSPTLNNISSNSFQNLQHDNDGYSSYNQIRQQHLPSCMYETQISPMYNQTYINSTTSNFNQPHFGHTNNFQTTKTVVSRSLGQGPIQLWEFLLELLLDPRLCDVIAWTGDGWEFKLINPEVVAELWGRKKCKPKMNYEKLSRGLRYYYDKRIIIKTAGKRYVYRFVCDMRQLIHCDSPQELYSTKLQTNYKKAFYNLS